MKSSQKIIKIDPIFINHEHLIEGTGICGIEKAYHDPRMGTVIILSRDKPFTCEWHEGAHAFITQRGFLGLFLISFTNALYVLTLRFRKIFEDEKSAKKIALVIERLKRIRRTLATNFKVLHEVFALSTERHAIIDSYLRKYGNTNKYSEECSKEILGLDKSQFSKGLECHKKALKLMEQLDEKYGVVLHGIALSQWALCIFPVSLIEIDPSILLYGEYENLNEILPNPNGIIESVINDPPKWAPDKSYKRICDFMDEIQRRAASIGKYKHPSLFPEGAWSNWINKFISILPLDDDGKKFLHSMQLNSYAYDILLWKGRLSELRKLTQIKDVNTKEEEGKSEEKGFVNPLKLPPPIALIYEDECLKLGIRKDINNPGGLYHMAIRNISIATNEIFLGEGDIGTVILCFSNYADYDSKECKHGPEKCETAQTLCELVKIRNIFSGLGVGPTLICTKNNKARIFLLSKSKSDLIQVGSYPFKIFETKPLI